MKKVLLPLAALALLTATAHAQITPTPPANAQASPATPLTDRGALNSPEQQAQNQANLLAKELSLTPEQQTRVQQAFTASRQERQATLQKAGGNRRAMAQAMRADRDKLETQLKGILTPDQFTKYQQLIAQRRGQIRERRTLQEN
jgi:protein CpxP